MNPLGNGPAQQSRIPEQLRDGIRQVKGLMNMAKGNPTQILQQLGQNNPMFSQVMQMCKGQDPQAVFINLCKQSGIDPQAILNELQN